MCVFGAKVTFLFGQAHLAIKGVMKTFQDFLHIMHFIGNQTVQGPNERFSAASNDTRR